MARPILWVGIAGEETLRIQYQAFLTRLIAGEGLSYEEMHTSSQLLKGMATLRLTLRDRLLVKTIKKNGQNYVLIMEEILEHRHDNSLYLNDNDTNKEKEERFLRLISGLKESDFVIITISVPAKTSLDKLAQDYQERPNAPMCHENTYPLTEQQKQAMDLILPLWVVANAGFGKTYYAAEYLRKWMDALIENLKLQSLAEAQPMLLVYVAKTEKLVRKFKEQYLALKGAQTAFRQASVQFKTLKELVYDNLLLPEDRKRSCVAEAEFSQWFARYQKIWKKKEKADSRASGREPIDRSRIFSKTDLVYKEFCYMVVLRQEAYLASGIGVRGTKDYFTAEERIFLWDLCQNYIRQMCDANRYDLSLNPPPFKTGCCHGLIADELQIFSPKEIDMIVRFLIHQQALLLLYGRGQSWNLCNRTFVSALNIPMIQFTKSLRNPYKVTQMANNAIRAQLHFGSPDKQEFRSETMEPNCDIQGDIYWEDPSQIPESMCSNPNITLVTRKEYVEEAKKRFRTSLVFTPDQIQGADCDNLVLYKMFDHPVFDHISAHLPEEEVALCKGRAKASAYTEQDFSTGEIHTAFDEWQVALTRASHKITIFESQPRSRERLLNAIKKGVPISHLSREEKADASPVSTADAWLARAEKEHKEGHESHAIETLALLHKKFPESFTNQRIKKILASWKPKAETEIEASALPKASAQGLFDEEKLSEKKAMIEGSELVSLRSILPVIQKKYTNRERYKSEKDFTALLDQPQCTNLLFTIQVDQKDSLLAHFMRDEWRATLFKDAFVKSKKYGRKIPGFLVSGLNEEEGPLLHCFTRNEKAGALFKYLIETVPSFATEITALAFFTQYPVSSNPNFASALLSACELFSETPQGNNIIGLLFAKNRDLLPKIPQALFQDEAGTLVKNWVKYEEGIAVLQLVASQSPNLINSIPKKVVLEILGSLKKTVKGRELTEVIFQINPEFKRNNEMTTVLETLSKPKPFLGLGQAEAKVSVPKWKPLSKKAGSYSELNTLKGQFSNWYERASVFSGEEEDRGEKKEIITNKRGSSAQIFKSLFENPTDFWDYYDNNMTTLLDMVHHYPGVISAIEYEDFLLIFTGSLDCKQRFQKLGHSMEGRFLLSSLLDHNKKWAIKMPWYFWIMQFDPNLPPVLRPPFQCHNNLEIESYLPKKITRALLDWQKKIPYCPSNKEEMRFFCDVLMQHFNVTNLEIYLYLLCVRENIDMAFFATFDKLSCFFEKMIGDPNYQAQFVAFLQSTKHLVFLEIVARRLCQPFPGAPEGAMSALFEIVACCDRRKAAPNPGIAFLKHLFDWVPNFRISKEAFYQQDKYHRSLFFFIAAEDSDLLISFVGQALSEQAVAIIQKKYPQLDHPGLFDDLPRRCIFDFILKERERYPDQLPDPYENTSTFFMLCELNKYFLFVLSLKDNSLFQGLTVAQVYKQRALTGTPNSLLYQLSFCAPSFLYQLLKNNPALAKLIPEIAWRERVSLRHDIIFMKQPRSAVEALAANNTPIFREIYDLLPENIQALIDIYHEPVSGREVVIASSIVTPV